jgi:Peptidase C13 family
VRLGRLRLALRAATLWWAIVAGLLVAGAAAAKEPPEQGQEQAQQPASPGFDAESVSRRQPLLLEQALAEMEGTRADLPPRLFFVGFAGYGWEAVFKREALAVRALFDERFGTRGRSLTLVNHPSTVDDIALASPANLDRALQHIGTLMNKDSDTLFLFLTSHGRRNLFAVEMPGFAFDGLTPAALKAMLDRAGIKNRVVVVSACHSGSFISTLADASTLVIAAAHADRTSFGCEDRREWTYFGDAFFNRALRQERSFERAFQVARRTIGHWERQEGLVRSLPQIAGGKALKRRLDELARASAR